MIKENTVKEYLIKNFDIDEKVVDFCLETEKEIKDVFENVDSVAEINQYKV